MDLTHELIIDFTPNKCAVWGVCKIWNNYIKKQKVDGPIWYYPLSIIKQNHNVIFQQSLNLKDFKIHSQVIRKIINCLDWNVISTHWCISEKFIFKFANHLKWKRISKYQKLSESVIRTYNNYVHWEFIFEYQTLSESFMYEFDYRIDWNVFAYYKKMSCKFIRDHIDKVNWDHVSAIVLSFEFMYEFRDKINWHICTDLQIIPDFIER